MARIGVVADTGPLVAFAKIERLDLLANLFGVVFVPPAVERELTAKRSEESRRLYLALGTLLHIAEQPEFAPEVSAATLQLDIGEANAIALAYNRSLWLVIDDKLGRKAASRLNIPVLGSVGIVLEAKRRGHLSRAVPILLDMQRKGYWLSDTLISHVAGLAGEAEPID